MLVRGDNAGEDTGAAPERQSSAGPLGLGMDFHHIGVAVKSIDKALDYYVGAFGFRKATEILDVPSEHVRVCFVAAPTGVLIELVEGLGDDSPVADVLDRPGAGPYHLCYSVPDLDTALERLRANHCFLLKRFDRPAYGHSRFAFLLTPDRQLFELCESEGDREAFPYRTEPRTYTFKTLFFEATRQCNLACPMCMASSNNEELVEASRERELTVDEIERHILATARDIGVETITWSGGEYLMRAGAIELVRKATAYGYYSTVCTNAFQVTSKELAELKEASAGTVVVAVGINSIEDENSWTRNADCATALDVLEMCDKLDIRRHVVVNVGKHNEGTLDRTLQWLEDQNIPYNRSPFTPRGSGRDYWEELGITARSMEDKIHPELRKHPNGYVSYTPFFLSPELHERYSKGERNVTVPQNPSIGCWCGTWLAVNAEGDVSPCGILLDDLKCGNVREKSFQQIIDESPEFQKVLDRNLLQGKCGRCRYKFTCGGCRAMAYYTHGDIMAEDPTCFFEPEDESTVSPHEEQTGKMFKLYAFMARHAARDRRLRKASPPRHSAV